MKFVFEYYHVRVMADSEQRRRNPVTRAVIRRYAEAVCEHLHCTLFALQIADGTANMIIRLNPQISLADFVRCLKGWTSNWILGTQTTAQYTSARYWEDGFFLRTLSPEELQPAIDCINATNTGQGQDLFYAFGLKRCTDATKGDVAPDVGSNIESNAEDGAESDAEIVDNYHHIILITSRHRRLLRTKYKALLHGQISEICAAEGVRLIEIGSMRNHIHLLCNLPVGFTLATFAANARNKIFEWMQTNIHYRNVGMLEADFLAFTVGHQGISREISDICHQDEIHHGLQPFNEMATYYPRLNCSWFASLH